MRSTTIGLVAVAALAACNDRPATPPPPTPSTTATIPIGCEKVLGATQGLDAQTTVFHQASVQVGTELPIAVPPGTVSLTVIEQALSAPDVITQHIPGQSTPDVMPNTAIPLTITDPTGKIVHDDHPGSGGGDITQLPSFFASESPAAGTITIPNTSAGLAALVRPGTWKVLVSDYAYECATGALLSTPVTCDESSRASTYDVTVITKQAPGGAIPSAGTIDFTFYFATQRADDPATGTTTIPLTRANAEAGKDPDLARMVQTLGVLLAQGGLTLGNVQYRDLPADLQATFDAGVDVDVRGACAELPQMLAHSEPGNAANIFLVSRLTGGSAGAFTVIGVDGTIPGPASVGGTVASGAAVSTEDLRANRSACSGTAPVFSGPFCGADLVAFVAAHETGHFMGLYHTTEQEGLDFDTLVDTPTCPCSTCKLATGESCATSAGSSASTHLMTTLECNGQRAGCAGSDNLMFWLFGSAAKGTLTPEQQQVIRANPLVH
jgi:hypothetical protein